MNVILVILDSLRKDHIGVYGNDRIQTPNLDALAKESLRFTRAYPESLPTLCARRAIHTGMRTWPFRNFVRLPGETFQPAGWQPIPEQQTTLSETLFASGYSTALFADTQPMFHPSMNFQRGFGVFEWIRGQERDRFRPKLGVPEEQIRQRTVPGNDANMVDKVRQYLANTQDRRTEEDWFAPRLFTRGMDYLEQAEDGQPFFLVLDSFDPHEPWDPPEEYVDPLQRRLRGQGSHRAQLRHLGLDRRGGTGEDEGAVLGGGDDGRPLVRPLPRQDGIHGPHGRYPATRSGRPRRGPRRARLHGQALRCALARADGHTVPYQASRGQGSRTDQRLLRLYPRRGPDDTRRPRPPAVRSGWTAST